MSIEQNQQYWLHNTDSLTYMQAIPSNTYDCCVTDPPFGIGFSYGGKKEATDTAEDYWQWFEQYAYEIERVVRPGGLVAIWQTQLHFKHFWGWYGDGIHIYCAAKNFVQLRKTPINYGYDPVVMWYKAGGVPMRPDKPGRSIDFFVANTAGVVSNTKRIEKGHPCPRPLDAVTEILNNFTKPGCLVLDPFMGSGTTGVASINTGRRFVGIEINTNYYEIAQKRCDDAISQKSTPEGDKNGR